jgi:hypothetical protein
MNAQQIKDKFNYYTQHHKGLYLPSEKAHGIYVNALNKACKSDANRKLVLKYLTGETSSKKLTDNQWIALKKMCDIHPVELERVCGAILAEVVKQDGQLELMERHVCATCGFTHTASEYCTGNFHNPPTRKS